MVLSPAVTPAVFDVCAARPGPSNDEDELGLGSLTAREREVLNLLARGHSNREIAEELVITNKTVKNHLSRIYEKIGVHSAPRRSPSGWACATPRGSRPGPWDQGVPRGFGTPGPSVGAPGLSEDRIAEGFLLSHRSTTSGGSATCRTSPPRSEDATASSASRLTAPAFVFATGPADQRGQTAAEYMGILLVVAVIIGALIAADVDGKIANAANEMVDKIKGGNEKR